MADAYRCDRCNVFCDGGDRWVVTTLLTTLPRSPITRDLCPLCAGSMDVWWRMGERGRLDHKAPEGT